MRLFRVQIALLILLTVFIRHVSANEGEELTPDMISGQTAILIDGTTGQVLFEKSPDIRKFPASITKIATAIYAIENGNLNDIVTVSKNARNEEGTRVYLAEGEKVTLEKLVNGLLINSGNDAGTAIAEHMAGSNKAFSDKVNAYLREKTDIHNTHFTNPHGLHDDNHYTTASDMAKITRYAMKNDKFREIVATKHYEWIGEEWQTVLVNHNKMLVRYEGTTGVKNGFTDQARNTLVISAKRNGSEFIAVTMAAQSAEHAYTDMTLLMDYAFAHYETKQVAKAGEEFAVADGKTEKWYTDEPLYVTVPLDSSFQTKLMNDGSLAVIGEHGELAHFPLKPKQVPTRVSSGNSPSKQTVSEAPPFLPKVLIFISWLLLNVLLVVYLYARRRKRRMMRRQIYRW